MDGHCLSERLIYKTSFNATISKYYCGTYENNFKENSNNQTGFFRNKFREKNTELCKQVRKEKDINNFINLDIAMKSQKYLWIKKV